MTYFLIAVEGSIVELTQNAQNLPHRENMA